MQLSNIIVNHQCWLTYLEKPLYQAKLIAIFITAAIAGTVMLGWLNPNFSALLPTSWHKMQPTTAITLLLLSTSLGLKTVKTQVNTKVIQVVWLAFALIVLCTVFYEHLNNKTVILSNYLVANAHSSKVHPTSIQSAVSLLLITILAALNEKSKGFLGYVMCSLLSVLVLLIMVFLSSYLFGAYAILSSNSFILISKQTLFCIILLTAVIYTTRGPYSVFSVIFSTSLGGQFARRVLTITMIALFLVMSLQALLLLSNSFHYSEIIAATATANIALLFFIIVNAANKIESQALELEQLVITDKLTATYNLRGLYLHAEQKLLEARRNNTPLSVLMFDLDGLKVVNDQVGHEAGSALIKTYATTLKNNYRSSDIVARVGGDEFIVITMEDEKEVQMTLDRFAKTISEINTFAKQPYHICYSVGIAQLQPNSTETIDSLIKIADQRMYAAKKAKKEQPAQTQPSKLNY